MTKPIKASTVGLRPHFKVRVVLPSAMLHLASVAEPMVSAEGGQVSVAADWIEDPAYGDTLGWIDWTAIVGITWRWSS